LIFIFVAAGIEITSKQTFQCTCMYTSVQHV